MASYQKDLAEIQAKVHPLLGKKAWKVQRGVASFVTMEFGDLVLPKYPRRYPHGEWHLWVYGGVWRLEKGERVVVASEDDHTKIEREIACLEGCVLQAFDVNTPAFDAVLTFERGILLRIFGVFSEETEETGMDIWKLYTPDEGKVLSVHPGGKWSYVPGDHIPS